MFCKKHKKKEKIEIPEDVKKNLKKICKEINLLLVWFFEEYKKCYDNDEFNSEKKMIYLLNNDTNSYEEVQSVIGESFPNYNEKEVYDFTKLVDDVGYAQFPVYISISIFQ